jgi:hypothetical protein
VAGRDIEERHFIGFLGVVHLRDFDRVAGVDVVDVLHTLDHSTLVDVETWNDALHQHESFSRVRPISTAPV